MQPQQETEISREISKAESNQGGISQAQADDLDLVLSEALFRVSFFMQTDYLRQVDNLALRQLIEACSESVEIRRSTIVEAGSGLFATRNIPKHTVVALYPVHCIGCKFPSGLCQSVQVSGSDDQINIDHEKSQYTLFSYGNRPLCGLNLREDFGGAKLFVDMNPAIDLPDGWSAGMINDASTVQHPRDLDYYERSRKKQNTDILPFSTAPFHVAMTTRDVARGEELFVSYGYRYWANAATSPGSEGSASQGAEEEVFENLLKEKESRIARELENSMEILNTAYIEAAWVLGQIFDHEMNGEQPPSLAAPTYPSSSPFSGRRGSTTNLGKKVRGVVRRRFEWLLRKLVMRRT